MLAAESNWQRAEPEARAVPGWVAFEPGSERAEASAGEQPGVVVVMRQPGPPRVPVCVGPLGAVAGVSATRAAVVLIGAIGAFVLGGYLLTREP